MIRRIVARQRFNRSFTIGPDDSESLKILKRLGSAANINLSEGKVRRSSSRFCLGVEHGDYNGTKLFGVGTNRFIWMAYKPNSTNKLKLFSGNFEKDGVTEIDLTSIPPPNDKSLRDTWFRFAFGCVYILNREGYNITKGFDGCIYGNIPGGGMSRSASLALNLIITLLEVNGLKPRNDFDIVKMAQMVENDYIGSPCGVLDQAMIYYAKENMGTHFDPATNAVSYVPLGSPASEKLRLVALDTGTQRHGLEKSTYSIRRAECDQLVDIIKENRIANIKTLADVKEDNTYQTIVTALHKSHPHLCKRLKYIYEAQLRFETLMGAWKEGQMDKIGDIFRKDGWGLRDDYVISGPELETMCDIVRTVPGVLGERMLGGGDKGAAGAIIDVSAEHDIKKAVDFAYPKCHPSYKDKYAVHILKLVQGIAEFDFK